jgi:hypothetical protein
MLSAFQSNAFQNNAFQVADTPIIIFDTHDGDKRKRITAAERRLIESERERNRQRRDDIINAFERVVEGKPEFAAEIAEPYLEAPTSKRARRKLVAQPHINFDKLINDVDRVQRLWEAFIELDDEEVLALL